MTALETTGSEPMSLRTKILIADDHDAVLEGIRSLASSIPGMEVVGTARDGMDALEQIESLKPDIAILDVSMPRMNGVELARRVSEIAPSCRMIVFSMYSDREYVLGLFRAGVAAYVLKEDPLSELANAIEAVRTGANYYAEAVRKIVQEQLLGLELHRGEEVGELPNGISALSIREKEVFPLLADGLTIKEIARQLCISPKTVETHKYNIMEKLDVKSLADLTKLAIRKELIQS